jgi:DnaJ-class molecular chaperone
LPAKSAGETTSTTARITMDTFFRRYESDRDAEELLDPDNHHSEPWGGGDVGPCDKCDGSGRTTYKCLSCIEGDAAEACPACQGRVHFEEVCPACEGTGVIDRTKRRGVSVFPSLDGLYRYLVERDAGLEDSVIVELGGELSPDRDLDADSGALLVFPTTVIALHAIDPARVAAVRERLVRDAA